MTSQLNRRVLLMSVLSAAAAPSLARSGGAGLARRLGVQTYMLDDQLRKDTAGTLARLHAVGFRELELFQLPGMSAQAFRAELDRAGLSCPSIHAGLEPLVPGAPNLAEPDTVIAAAKALGAVWAVVPVLPFRKALATRPEAQARLAKGEAGAVLGEVARSMTVDEWTDLAVQLNTVAAKLAPSGVRLAYHNHNLEFVTLGNGRPALELLLARTDPKLVDLELDVGWVAAAGVDPAAFLRRHGARVGQVHFKDLAATTPNNAVHLETADIGRGVQDWEAILEALRGSAVRHAYIEEEPPYVGSGLEAAARSYAWLQPLMARLDV
jgi:sugar phosphate isomerase/epimerase